MIMQLFVFSPEPSLLTNTKYDNRSRFAQNTKTSSLTGYALHIPFKKCSLSICNKNYFIILSWLCQYLSFSQVKRMPVGLVQQLVSQICCMIPMTCKCGSKIELWSGPEVIKLFSCSTQLSMKGVCALRGYFGPPMRSKYKSCSSQVSSKQFIRTIAKV